MIGPTKILAQRLRAFRNDLRGSLSVEAVLIFPLLMWAYAAMFVYFDAFRAQNTNLKAAYTISDMVSRETNGVSANYIEGLNTVFDYLTKSTEPTWVRVTIVYCDQDCYDPARVLKKDWSYATDGKPKLTDADVQGSYDSKIPILPLGERLIMVETFVDYQPAFNVGLDGFTFENFVATRPRFAGQVAPGAGIDIN